MVVKVIYKTIRSILFSVTLFIVGLYVVAYTLFSIPTFTNWVKNLATSQLESLIGGTIEISDLRIYPFNEVRIAGIEVFDPEAHKVMEIETLAAGISLWKLIYEHKIELSFGEIIGLNAFLEQQEEGGPLNIQYIIDAFSSKDNKKEKKEFELALRNVVLRKSSLSFFRPWCSQNLGDLDLSKLEVTNLAADISFPKISNKGLVVDLRRLSFAVPEVTEIEKLSFRGEFFEDKINLDNFILQLPRSRIFIPNLNLEPENGKNFAQAFKEDNHSFEISSSYITLADFSSLFPPLNDFSEKLDLSLQGTGNLDNINIDNFYLGNPELLVLALSGAVEGLGDFTSLSGEFLELNLFVSHKILSSLPSMIKGLPSIVEQMLPKMGDFHLKGEISGEMAHKSFSGDLEMNSDAFEIFAQGNISSPSPNLMTAEGEINLTSLHVNRLIPSLPIGNVSANLVAEGSYTHKDLGGMISLVVEDFEYKGKTFDGFSINLNKEDEIVDGDLFMHNAIADIEAKFSGDIIGEEKSMKLDVDFQKINLSEILDMKTYEGYLISGSANLDADIKDKDLINGDISLNNMAFVAPDNSKSLRLKKFNLLAASTDSVKTLNLASDWLEARVEGNYKINELPHQLKHLALSVFPVFSSESENKKFSSNLEFDILVKRNNSVAEFFNLPVRLLTPINIAGTVSGEENNATLTFDLPYLQQGKDKLIYDTKLVADINGDNGSFNALIETNVPVKRGDLSLNVSLFAQDNKLNTDIHWANTENPDFYGKLDFNTEVSKNPLTQKPEVSLQLLPAVLHLGTADWNLSETNIAYTDRYVTIDGLKLWHDEQFVEVKGIASPEFADQVTVILNDIDVDYVFDMLQINYVTFGGTATGEIIGHALLSGDPVAETESLIIRDFTYNGANLGECIAWSRWNNEAKEIEIGADITQDHRQTVTAKGGIWIGRDSLSFDIDANRVPVDFVQPFMAVFSSHVGGFATGDVKLFGTFHDIDITGKVFADSVAVKLDYTNTIYHGSDTVFLNPGKIEIPNFRLYDKFGNSALLTGELSHTYFHDPSFTFRLSEADNFLCYDTNSDLNPDWYGTLFGSGSALLNGVPGVTDISADMTVSGNSNFTFVLSDAQYAQDYQFLTFSDKRAEAAKSLQPPTTQDIKAMLKQKMNEENEGLSRFSIDIRASVTPQVLFTLIMDPAAGDKITARGRGAMQMKYESDNDELAMYGKYEIDEGNYNFSLQDIILRDFKIKEGSYITFNGNPLNADLDISATYRVNTNLSDLDKSFSTDRDLNRTNVPVDAVLSVTGNMTQPDITFDIELPTLTQDVERKVKSIISTDDMMNRQIIYLLALNRFYTPEYMGSTGNGGELAAVASSTISSQLSNILGQLTDKFSVSPSFRSDKGDFSDIEVDVALSSRLLNNRLLINGNFGYRDRSNSSTTFVGDFDVEYLLSKNGNLRLKAYNHFNDQNYYLREALTTQGLGIVYRKDFDDWFTFLKKKKKTATEDGN